MKKNNILFFILIILISLSFTAYGVDNSFSAENGNSEHTFTKQQAIVDYEYMWDVLEQNYPTFNLAERMYGINVDDIKESGLRKIMERKNMSITFFYTTLVETFKNFKDIFHLAILPPEFYRYFNKTHNSPFQFVTDWDKSTKVYDHLEKSLYKTLGQTLNTTPSNNIKITIINDKTAMITINSFLLNDNTRSFEDIYKDDDDGLLALYTEIEGYENLIFDISRNGGGADWYWAAYIVAPNIVENISFTHTLLAKSGEMNLQYFNLRGIDVSTDLSEVTQLPNVNKEDLNDVDLVHTYTNGVPTMVSTKAFSGNIFVLIDKPVFSASESFAMFCKKTGFATLVGKNSSGDGAGYDPVIVSLPESGVLFRYSSLYTLNEDGSCNQEYGTTPDYICEGTETPLQTCLKIIDMKSDD